MLRRLAHLQATRPFTILAWALLLVALGLWSASKLRVEGGFEHLLPDGRASVTELHRVAARTAGVSTLFIVLEVPPDSPPRVRELRAAGDALVVALRNIGEPWVGSADDGVKDVLAFLEPRAGLYAKRADLEQLTREIDMRWEYEVQRELGMLLDDEEPPSALDERTVRKLLHLDDATATGRYPDGYFQSADGRTLVVAVRSKVLGSDVVQGREVLRKVREAIQLVGLTRYDAQMRYGLAGDLYAGVIEVSALNEDLTHVGMLGAGLIGAAVLLFYLRIRPLFVMLATISIGIAWTAGMAQVAVGNLNIGSMFVFTIVAGNGLNASVIYMARYLEAKRVEAPVETCLYIAHRETLVATAAACAASSAAFASLLATEFRGFRDLGAVGALGLVLCWVATVSCLPALLAALERYFPIDAKTDGGGLGRVRAVFGAGFGKPFAKLVPLAPRAMTIVGVGLAALGFVGLVRYVESDPMEYDMSRLRNDVEGRATVTHYKELADEITGWVGGDGMAMLVDRTEQVRPLRDALYAIRDAAAADQKPFSALYALEDFVPEGQDDKIPILLDLARRLRRMHDRGAIPEDTWSTVARYLPSEDLRPITMANLPEGIARPFTEADGTRGRIVYITPIAEWIDRGATLGAAEDARYLLRWALSYRETTLPDGSKVLGSGRAVIYADMWEGVLHAVPTATLAAILAVIGITVISFRRGQATLYVLGALAVGIGWMAGMLVVLGIKLNFLNFVALPITFGIGVEYAVNIVYRSMREGRGGALTALRETGGAVVLCSLTTILGYAALLGSINAAVRSLGLVAVIGEVCTLLAAMLVLPAFMQWREGAR